LLNSRSSVREYRCTVFSKLSKLSWKVLRAWGVSVGLEVVGRLGFGAPHKRVPAIDRDA
jgi:hypothetical protein